MKDPLEREELCAAMHRTRETRHESKYHLVEIRALLSRGLISTMLDGLSQHRGTSSRRLFLRPRRKGKVARGCAYQAPPSARPEECALEWKPACERRPREKGRKTEIGRMKRTKGRASERGMRMRSYGVEQLREWTRRTYVPEVSCVTNRISSG